MTTCICLSYTGPAPLGPTIQLTCNPSGTIINESTVNLTTNCPYCITVPNGTTTITAFDPVTECSEIISIQPANPTPCSSGMDVVFCVDYTGSMGPVINKIKQEIISLVGPIILLSQNNYRLGLVIFDERNGSFPLYAFSYTYLNLPPAQKYVNSNVTVNRFQFITSMEIMSQNNQVTFTEQMNKLNAAPPQRVNILQPNGDSVLTFTLPYQLYQFLNNNVLAVKTQVDNKTVVCGLFSLFTTVGPNAPFIFRITQTGSIDNSFLVGQGFDSYTWCLDINSVGQIVVGGQFLTYQGVSRKGITLLNTNGSMNSAFNPGTGFNTGSIVKAVKFDQNGKILVGGDFTSYSGVSVNKIVRLNINGSIDPTFVIGSGFGLTNDVNTIDIDELTGNIVVGGLLDDYNGTIVGNIVILNNSGGIVAVPPFTNGIVKTVKFESNGKVLFGGLFTNYNTTTCNRIGRLNSNFTVDNTFLTNLGTGFNNDVNTITTQSIGLNNGKIIVGGNFLQCNSVNVNRIVRLNNDGSIDYTFGGCDTPPHSPQGGFQNTITSIDIFNNNDSIFVGGNQNNYYNTNCYTGMQLGFGAGAAEPSDIAIDRIVNYDIAGSFNNSNAKYIVLITDNFPGGNDDTYTPGIENPFILNTLIPSCQINNIKVILVKPTGVSLPILEQMATSTGGLVVSTAFNENFNLSSIATTIATLC